MRTASLLLSTLLLCGTVFVATGCMNHFAAVQRYQESATKACMEKYHDAEVCAALPYPSEQPR